MSRQIYQTQKKIYQHMKKRALRFETISHAGISAYRANFDKFSNRKFATSSHAELNQSLLNSNFIFVGDFHTFDQSLKNLIRILKFLTSKNKKIILALEMVSHSDSKLIESYLNGHLTELEFLESINFEKSWKFPWTHYRTIFDFAKTNPQIEIIGVNTNGTLLKRDKFCANTLAKKWLANPSNIFVTLYGEYHLAPNKIPKFLQLQLKHQSVIITTLHQNLDKPYWKLVKKSMSLKHDLIIKYNSREFCLLTSPPWMKFESMTYWYENLYDDPDYDINQYIIENGLKVLSSNTADNFEFLCRQIISLFHLSIKPKDIAFTLYDHLKLQYIERFINSHYKNPKIIKNIMKQLETQHFLVLPDTEKIYCASYSSNKMTKLAGTFLYQTFCNIQGIKTSLYFTNKTNEQIFCYLIISSFHAYFMAKSVNPYIKCDMYLDLKMNLKKSGETPDRKIALLVVKILEQPENIKAISKSLDITVLLPVAKMLGELIAESSFQEIQNNTKHFDASKWRKKFLTTNHDYKSVIDLIYAALKYKGFKQIRKRYY